MSDLKELLSESYIKKEDRKKIEIHLELLESELKEYKLRGSVHTVGSNSDKAMILDRYEKKYGNIDDLYSDLQKAKATGEDIERDNIELRDSLKLYKEWLATNIFIRFVYRVINHKGYRQLWEK